MKSFSFVFRRIIIGLALIFVVQSAVFSNSGSMSGAGEIKIAATKWFDIIYSEKNETTARILYQKADDVYEKLAADYEVPYQFRMPVVITSTVEQFNAYWTSYPYNHIVIYDAAQISDLAVFSETLISTFTHELTHAVTYNLKSPSSRYIGKIFGDAVNASYFTVTSGMAEGATVSYESATGEGRLNDPFSLQMVRQAKIENKYPTYSDVKGAADVYPKGSFYYFNGIFAQWLQEKYGLKKYAQFWYRCVNLKNITAAGAFKKVYGIKIDKAWKQCKNDLYIPENVETEILAKNYSFDYFASSKKKFSIKNSSGSLYSNLSVSEKGIAYLDEKNGTVYLNNKKLFTWSMMDYAKQSDDGRYFAVSGNDYLSATIKHIVKVYDTVSKKFIPVNETSLFEPAVIKDQTTGIYYLICQKYENQQYSLKIKQIKNDSVVDIENIGFSREEVPSSIIAVSFDEKKADRGQSSDKTDNLGNKNGTYDRGQSFGYIKKAGLEYSICISDLQGTVLKEYKLPFADMRIRFLSKPVQSKENENLLVFTWAIKNTLPRLGMLDLSTGEFKLYNQDLSGGIYYPVLYENQFVYVGNFYRQNRLLKLNNEKIAFKTYSLEDAGTTIPKITQITINQNLLPVNPFIQTEDDLPELNGTAYNPLAHFYGGMFIPFSMVESKSYLLGSKEYYSLPLGFTYFTSLPWSTQIMQLSGGYGTDTESAGISFNYSSGTDTPLFNYSLGGTFEFNKNGFKQLSGDASIQSSLYFGNRSAVGIVLQDSLVYGKYSISVNNKIYETTSKQYYNEIQGGLLYSNIISSGPGVYQRSGFSVKTEIISINDGICNTNATENLSDLGFFFSLNLPGLIPVNNYYGFTYNLPAKLKCSLFDISNSLFPAASINADVMLFSYNIQKAIPGLSAIYSNDISLIFSYNGGYSYSEQEYSKNWHFTRLNDYAKNFASYKDFYSDYASLKLSLGITPNIGSVANNQLKTNLYAVMNFGQYERLKLPLFDFGFETSF